MGDQSEEDSRSAPWGSVETRFEPIHSLARMRDAEGVRLEIDKGVPVDVLNGKALNGDGGNTALWFAAQGPWPNGLDVVKVLVGAGADVNRQCEHGRSALHMASAWGHLDVVKYLLDAGADPAIDADEEGTPADMARSRGCQEVSEFFASMGL